MILLKYNIYGMICDLPILIAVILIENICICVNVCNFVLYFIKINFLY